MMDGKNKYQSMEWTFSNDGGKEKDPWKEKRHLPLVVALVQASHRLCMKQSNDERSFRVF